MGGGGVLILDDVSTISTHLIKDGRDEDVLFYAIWRKLPLINFILLLFGYQFFIIEKWWLELFHLENQNVEREVSIFFTKDLIG